jgi:hypothetical protein
VTEPTESAKFDAVVRKMMSVSHDEIKKRDVEWRRKRKLSTKIPVPTQDRFAAAPKKATRKRER